MGKHIIPQYYLRGFSSDGEEKNIFVFEKGSDGCKELPIKAVAQSKNYYSDEIEKFLAEEIESKANPILKKLKEGGNYFVQDKQPLAKYFCILAQRVEKHKERIDNLKPKVIDSFFNNNRRAIQELILKKPEKKDLLEKRLLELDELQKNYESEIPKDVDDKCKKPMIREAIVEHFIKMKWRVIYSIEQEYITSDNPVFFFESVGIANDISEVTVPITKNIGIFMTNELGKDEIVRKISNRVIREFNRRTVFFASRFVYCAKSYHWLENLMLKNKHKLNRILLN